MKAGRSNNDPVWRLPLLGVIAWLVPGAAHLFIGERIRGIILIVVISLTFWTGIAVGGIKNTCNPQDRYLWFLGQVCAGVHPLIAIGVGRQIVVPPGSDSSKWVAYGQTEEVGVVYTTIAGMLNILAIFDVLARAEKNGAASSRSLSVRELRGST